MSQDAKIVFITGASSGIGAALAREFIQRGHKVALSARREDRLKDLQSELGANAFAVKADVTDQDSVAKGLEIARKHFGRIDIVIANAGFGVVGKVINLTAEDFQRQFDTNIFGVLRTFWGSFKEIERTQGSFVIIGSVNSYVSLPGVAAYAMSKHAVKALAESLTAECAPKGVPITLICPGFVQSEIRQVDNQGGWHEKAKDPLPAWLVMPSETAARQIVSAVLKRKREAVITRHGKIAVFLQRHFPWLVPLMIRILDLRGRGQPQPSTP